MGLRRYFVVICIFAVPCSAHLDARVREESLWTGFSPTREEQHRSAYADGVSTSLLEISGLSSRSTGTLLNSQKVYREAERQGRYMVTAERLQPPSAGRDRRLREAFARARLADGGLDQMTARRRGVSAGRYDEPQCAQRIRDPDYSRDRRSDVHAFGLPTRTPNVWPAREKNERSRRFREDSFVEHRRNLRWMTSSQGASGVYGTERRQNRLTVETVADKVALRRRKRSSNDEVNWNRFDTKRSNSLDRLRVSTTSDEFKNARSNTENRARQIREASIDQRVTSIEGTRHMERDRFGGYKALSETTGALDRRIRQKSASGEGTEFARNRKKNQHTPFAFRIGDLAERDNQHVGDLEHRARQATFREARKIEHRARSSEARGERRSTDNADARTITMRSVQRKFSTDGARLRRTDSGDRETARRTSPTYRDFSSGDRLTVVSKRKIVPTAQPDSPPTDRDHYREANARAARQVDWRRTGSKRSRQMREPSANRISQNEEPTMRTRELKMHEQRDSLRLSSARSEIVRVEYGESRRSAPSAAGLRQPRERFNNHGDNHQLDFSTSQRDGMEHTKTNSAFLAHRRLATMPHRNPENANSRQNSVPIDVHTSQAKERLRNRLSSVAELHTVQRRSVHSTFSRGSGSNAYRNMVSSAAIAIRAQRSHVFNRPNRDTEDLLYGRKNVRLPCADAACGRTYRENRASRTGSRLNVDEREERQNRRLEERTHTSREVSVDRWRNRFAGVFYQPMALDSSKNQRRSQKSGNEKKKIEFRNLKPFREASSRTYREPHVRTLVENLRVSDVQVRDLRHEDDVQRHRRSSPNPIRSQPELDSDASITEKGLRLPAVRVTIGNRRVRRTAEWLPDKRAEISGIIERDNAGTQAVAVRRRSVTGRPSEFMDATSWTLPTRWGLNAALSTKLDATVATFAAIDRPDGERVDAFIVKLEQVRPLSSRSPTPTDSLTFAAPHDAAAKFLTTTGLPLTAAAATASESSKCLRAVGAALGDEVKPHPPSKGVGETFAELVLGAAVLAAAHGWQRHLWRPSPKGLLA